MDGNYEPLPPMSPQPTEVDALEEDFFSECYYLRHPDEIVPELSLGTLAWFRPVEVYLPLPSTFQEAAIEAIAPRKPHAPGELSISDYYIAEKEEETLLSVRLLDEWRYIKDDPIFKEFESPTAVPILTTSELLSRYKCRTDETWMERAGSETPEPATEATVTTSSTRANLVATDADGDCIVDCEDSDEASEDGDVLGGLEQALQRDKYSAPGRHSRAGSNASMISQSARPEPLRPIRDLAQEQALASLGVTGEPKTVYQTPGPAIGPPLHQYERGTSRHSRQSSVASDHGYVQAPWPPPPPPGQPPSASRTGYYRGREDWRTDFNELSNIGRPSSSASQRTATGSDFGGENELTPRPKLNRTDSRKRNFEEDGGDANGETKRANDVTPKPQRHKQQRIHEAYR